MALDFEAWVFDHGQVIESALRELSNVPNGPLLEAMEYSLHAGGKRIRPLLCLAACESIGGDSSKYIRAACAVELIHTFSLIHDDLPAMDDDDLRRGIPTCHKEFGEATAILAGDALQAKAFLWLLLYGGSLGAIACEELANACVVVCAGQAADLQAEGAKITLDELKQIHQKKTGALLVTSCRIGGILGNATPEQLKQISRYAHEIGVAFQIVDDILDVTETSETLGKPANSDLKHDKATYPKLVGLDESRRLAREALSDALKAIEPLGEPAEPLRQIARWIVERNV